MRDLTEQAVGEECAICGEGECDAEMYDPQAEDGVLEITSHYVHAECGVAAGWEVS